MQAVHRLKCAEVWGGVRSEDVDACSAVLDASLFSLPCDGGGRGGDIYYFSVCAGDDLTRVAVADVVGHGGGAAAVSEWLFEAMRERMNSIDGGGVLNDLNRLAVERGEGALTTAAVAAIYRRDSRFYFSYAGHYPMLVLRQGRACWERLDVADGADALHLPLASVPTSATSRTTSRFRAATVSRSTPTVSLRRPTRTAIFLGCAASLAS